jgi:cardiolipin synthase
VLALGAAHRVVLHTARRSCWPPPPGAVTPDGAEAAVARDGPLDFAWSTAAALEPFVEGREFFPRILADVEAARSSVHILMFGWREGSVGMRMTELLERRLADGVEVRIVVDEFGSKPFKQAREMYERLTAAGAQLQVNRFLREQPGRVDHRKLYVIDGAVAWTGGAGIEDHFEDGRFHDVMVRVTGDVVRQAQAAFLTSLDERPAGLAHLFPAPDDAGAIEAIEAAARRGARTRVVVSERSNNHMATAALKHRYGELIAAGVELYEIPGTVVHAKVVIADDVVSFGTVNLDAWALYRNSELMMIARSAELAERFEERLFGPDIAGAKPGLPPAGARARAQSWACHKLAYYL